MCLEINDHYSSIFQARFCYIMVRPSYWYPAKKNYRRQLSRWQRYRQIHPIKPKHCCIVWNEPLQSLGCILPFPRNGDLGLAMNNRGMTLTSIATKIYNALLRNLIERKIENIPRKNQNGFRRNRSTTSQILTIRRILKSVRAKNLQATLLFVDFTKAFDSIHRGKMEQILLACGLPKETVEAITILYRNTKVKERSPDGDTEYFPSPIPLYHLSRLRA